MLSAHLLLPSNRVVSAHIKQGRQDTLNSTMYVFFVLQYIDIAVRYGYKVTPEKGSGRSVAEPKEGENKGREEIKSTNFNL